MLQRGDYAHEIGYFVVVHASPFPLQPTLYIALYYLLLISVLFSLALAGRIAFFFYPHSQYCVATHVCMRVCMYVKYTFVCNTTPRHMPHFVGDGEIN